MAFKSIQALVPAASGRQQFGNNLITFATDVCGRKGQPQVYAMRIGIPPEIAKSARIIKGDRVDILFDESSMRGLVKRVNTNGWRLVGDGKGSRLYVKVTIRNGMPTIASPAGCACEVTDEGVEFQLPEGVSFTENLRAKSAS